MSDREKSGYVNLAKGLPALIMNSGLMQVMAFLHEKGTKDKQRYYQTLAQQLRTWLHGRFDEIPTDFARCMTALMAAEPPRFQAINAEAFAWLKWVRQVSAAVVKGN